MKKENANVKKYHPKYNNEKLLSQGFPIMIIGDRVIIEPLDMSGFVTESGLVLVEKQGSRGNTAHIGRIKAISPDLYDSPRYPNFNLEIGQIVLFNHNAGNGMRLRVEGKMGEYWAMYIADILGAYVESEELLKQVKPGLLKDAPQESNDEELFPGNGVNVS